jgi:hypothetical protein
MGPILVELMETDRRFPDEAIVAAKDMTATEIEDSRIDRNLTSLLAEVEDLPSVAR